MKDNLGQERVERGCLSFHGKNSKIGTIYLDIPEKNDSFSSFDPIFHPSLPKIWFPHLHKNYIFEIHNNRAIR